VRPNKINNKKTQKSDKKHVSFFTLNHWTLADVDECSSGLTPCGPHSVCIDTAGSFLCRCINGYHRSDRNCTGNGFHKLCVQNKISLIRGAVLKLEKKNSPRCDWLTTFWSWCRRIGVLIYQGAFFWPLRPYQ